MCVHELCVRIECKCERTRPLQRTHNLPRAFLLGRKRARIASSRMHTVVSGGHELSAATQARCEVSHLLGEFVLFEELEATARSRTCQLVHSR